MLCFVDCVLRIVEIEGVRGVRDGILRPSRIRISRDQGWNDFGSCVSVMIKDGIAADGKISYFLAMQMQDHYLFVTIH